MPKSQLDDAASNLQMFRSHAECATTIHFTPTLKKRAYWTFKLTAPISMLRGGEPGDNVTDEQDQ
jgi:hypothetical protein